MKKVKDLVVLLFLIYITLQVIINSEITMNSVNKSILIFKNSIFPSLFPLLILSELLFNYNLALYFSNYFGLIISKLFKVSKKSSYIFFMSIISGFPSSAKFIKDFYLKKEIDINEATKILLFTHFSSPLFIMGFVKNILGFKYSLLVLITHYFSNIIVGLLFRNYINCFNKNNIIRKSPEPFYVVFKNSLKNSIETLLMILGTITFFLFIIDILNQTISNIYLKYFINSFLEMSNGINFIGLSDLSLKFKTIFITMIISFGGLSIHFQVLNIINKTKIKYQLYLIARLFHCALSGILVFLLLNVY